ncbi:MAG: hypothetical protein IAF58_08375, partial [Leptolyngbya sp.]|nr:hypothetical protein [Candidatus Melainabacteria bacterium]
PLKQASMGIDFPEELEVIVRKLLEKDPAQRYPSANVLATQLIALESKLKSKTHNQKFGIVSSSNESSSQFDTSRGFASTKSKTGPAQFFKGNPAGQLFISLLSFIIGMTASFILLQSDFIKSKPDLDAPQAVSPQNANAKTPGSENVAVPALPDKLSRITSKKNYREFNFPKNADFGAISLDDGTSMDCRGRIEIPPKHLVGFFPSYRALHDYPDLFKHFMSDDFALLYLSKNEAVTPNVIKNISYLTGLKGLNLKFSDIDDSQIKVINSLPNLCFLNVGFSNISGMGLKNLNNLPRLSVLSIDNLPNISACLPNICRMQSLVHLIVSKDGLQNDDLKIIARSKNINTLSLNSNKSLTDEGLKFLLPLKKLEWLNMYDTQLTPDCASSIRQFPKLKTLILPANNWSEEERTKFARTFPKLILYYGHVDPQIDENSVPGFPWDSVGLN